jgi:hypothetical protein
MSMLRVICLAQTVDVTLRNTLTMQWKRRNMLRSHRRTINSLCGKVNRAPIELIHLLMRGQGVAITRNFSQHFDIIFEHNQLVWSQRISEE